MKNKTCLPLFSILFCFLFLGCQHSEFDKEQNGLLVGNELTVYLDQMGKSMEEVKEGLSLTDEQLLETGRRGEWQISETREIEGEAFSQELLFDTSVQPQTLYTYRCILSKQLDNVEEIRNTTVLLAQKASEIYGDPITYPNVDTRIFNEERTPKTDIKDSASEMWEVSEDEVLVLKMEVFDGSQEIWLDYRVKEGLDLEYLDHIKNDG